MFVDHLSCPKKKVLSLLQYVADFRHKLSEACEIARSNLKSSQTKMKMIYDLMAKERNFNPGDKVLVLLPIIGNTLQSRYHGPYYRPDTLVLI